MSNKLTSLSLIICFLSALFATSCRKNSSSPDPVNPTNETVTTVIFGTVTDETNRPLAGVTINVNAQTVRTDAQGIFSSQGVTVTKKTVLKANYNGYFQSLHLLDLANKKTTSVQIKLQRKVQTTSFSSSAGGTATIGSTGASVVFPANGYKTVSTNQSYTGDVVVYARFANIDSEKFIQTVPGTMTATDANGVDSRLRTFGMMEVLMTDASGNALQLNNSTATISMPVATSQASTAPNAMPLWSLDETTAIWKQEGTATKQGNAYVGTVSHFTWWGTNISQPLADRAAIKGRVVRMVNGVATPVSGVYIWSYANQAVGLGGQGGNESDGTFGVLFPSSVMSGITFPCYFYYLNSFSVNSRITVNIPVLSAGQLYDLGDIDITSILPTPAFVITGSVNFCNNTSAGALSWINFYDNNMGGRMGTNTDGTFSAILPFQPTRAEVYSAFGEMKIINNISSNNLGVITLNCNNQISDNEYVINGDGFTNQKIILDNQVFAKDTAGYYRINLGETLYSGYLVTSSSGTTTGWGNVSPSSILLQGIGLVNYLPSVQGGNMKYYLPVSGTTIITSNTATEIQGTYSGVVRNTQTNVTANITAGKFRARKP